MTFSFPSDAWIKELSAQLNASSSYEASAKDWEGDFLFIVEADDAYPETRQLYLELYHGKSPSAKELTESEEHNAQYIISAPYSTWRKVLEGKIDPIQGMMSKRLKLKGNMMMVMRYPKAAKEIMACTQQMPTDFAA